MRGKFHLRPPGHASGPPTPEALYLAERPVIEEVVRAVARRRGMRHDEAEEFAATVRLRLVESDYEILRKFEGRSSLRTYLAIVIQRLALDYQAAKWGRWRPSAAARAGGSPAIRLEQLVVRDGLPLDEAVDAVAREWGEDVDVAALRQAAARFPIRTRRAFAGEEVLETLASGEPDVEQLLIRQEEAARFARIAARLGELLAELPETERLVIQLHFEQRLTVARVARMLHLDQKRLYRSLEHLLVALRAKLETEGIRAAEIARLLEAAGETGGSKLARPVRLSGSET
jgi:RNA polymerase sigma factor (sigma-70 family)